MFTFLKNYLSTWIFLPFREYQAEFLWVPFLKSLLWFGKLNALRSYHFKPHIWSLCEIEKISAQFQILDPNTKSTSLCVVAINCGFISFVCDFCYCVSISVLFDRISQNSSVLHNNWRGFKSVRGSARISLPLFSFRETLRFFNFSRMIWQNFRAPVQTH